MHQVLVNGIPNLRWKLLSRQLVVYGPTHAFIHVQIIQDSVDKALLKVLVLTNSCQYELIKLVVRQRILQQDIIPILQKSIIEVVSFYQAFKSALRKSSSQVFAETGITGIKT